MALKPFIPLLPLAFTFAQTAAAESWPDVNQPLRTGVKAPNDAAVVVSIEKYPLLDDQFAVPYATKDGDGFEHFLAYTAGIPQSNLHRLQDKTATSELIEAAFDDALKEAKNGTIWFYFAGHGAASEAERDQLILGAEVPMDERLMEKHALALKTLQRKIARSQVERAIFVIDACNIPMGKRFAAPVDLALQATSKPIVIWSAASKGEKSGPLAPARHGAFTYAALGALRGWADGEIDGQKDGAVSSEEAQAFVKRFLREQGVRDQTPQMLSKKNHRLSQKVKESAPDQPQGFTPAPSTAPPPQQSTKAAFKALISARFDTDTRDKQYAEEAANNWDLLTQLLEKGADVNWRDFDGNTILMKIAGIRDADKLKRILDAGAKVNVKNNQGKTALMNAADADSLTLLLASGAEIDARDNDGQTALYYEIRERRYDLAQQLLSAGANPNIRGRVGFLCSGKRPHDWSGKDSTLLMLACNKSMIQPLVNAGLDVNAQNASGDTAVIIATRGNQSGYLEELIAAGADVNIQNKQGQTALMFAAQEHNTEIVKILIDAGADVSLKDHKGRTASKYNSERGDFFRLDDHYGEIKKLLLSTQKKQRQSKKK